MMHHTYLLLQLYMLAGIYTGCGCAAVAIILIFLQQLPTEAGKKLKCSKDSCQPKLMVATFMQLKDYRQLLLIPLTMYSGLEQAFLASDYTQVLLIIHHFTRPAVLSLHALTHW